MATFTWVASYDPQQETTPRVRRAQFGDGYEQRVADGINSVPAVWDLEFNLRDTTEADAIAAFLLARGGIEAFDWTPPFGASGKYVCRSWRRRQAPGNWHYLTARFEQVFE